MINNIGFMQGRLCDQVDGMIQAFPWKDWAKEFKTANQIGIDLMEWTIDFNNLNNNPLMQKEGRIEISNLSKKYSVNINSLTGDCFMQKPFWKTSGQMQESLKSQFIKVAESCSRHDIKIIVLPLVDAGSIESVEEEKLIIDFMIFNSFIFKKLNIKIAFESDFPPEKLKRFIQKLDHQIFGINYDIGNSACLNFNPIEEFEAYGQRIINVHIKDRLLAGKTVLLGEGNADFNKVFELLSRYNYLGNLILQTARSDSGEHIEVIKQNFSFVLTLVQKYFL